MDYAKIILYLQLTDADMRLRHRWQLDREQLQCMTPPISPTLLKH